MAQRQCRICREAEPSFIHTIFSKGFERYCTNCLLKQYRHLFCPICCEIFDKTKTTSSQDKRCFNCSSVTHLSCSLPSSSSSTSTFICQPCNDPDFVFFPKSFVPNSEENGDNTLKAEWAKALVVAANISEVSLSKAAVMLREAANEKIRVSTNAKLKAKEALGILQDLVNKEKAAEKEKKKNDNNKRKESDR